MGAEEREREDNFPLQYNQRVCTAPFLETKPTADHDNSHKHNGKYCGMAEMSGPYNPDFNPKIWTGEMQGNEGSIPLRWLVAKEVLFPVFDGQKHNETPVTMMRHGNMWVNLIRLRKTLLMGHD